MQNLEHNGIACYLTYDSYESCFSLLCVISFISDELMHLICCHCQEGEEGDTELVEPENEDPSSAKIDSPEVEERMKTQSKSKQKA